MEKTDGGTPSVNGTTDREVAPDSLRFGRYLPRILQQIWEADLVQVPFQVSKLDVTDVYHRGTLRPCQVGTYAYVIPLAPGDKGCIICIDLVLPMGWVDSTKFFCASSETLTDVANALVDTDLPVPSYGDISQIPATSPPPPPHTHTHTLTRAY